MSEVKFTNPDFLITGHCADRVKTRILDEDEVCTTMFGVTGDELGDDPRELARQMLAGASIFTRKPRGLFGDGTADYWAVCGDIVFPLRRDRRDRSKLVALTVMRRSPSWA